MRFHVKRSCAKSLRKQTIVVGRGVGWATEVAFHVKQEGQGSGWRDLDPTALAASLAGGGYPWVIPEEDMHDATLGRAHRGQFDRAALPECSPRSPVGDTLDGLDAPLADLFRVAGDSLSER